jgi:sensor histidine kinase YesM
MKRSVEIVIHIVFFIFATLFILLLYEFITRGYTFHIQEQDSVFPLRFYWQFDQGRREMLLIGYFALIYGIITFYAFYAFFKPLLFDRKRYWLFFSAIISWIGILVIYRAIEMKSMYHPVLIVRDILIPAFFILSGTAFRFLKDWFLDQRQKEILVKQNLESQLDLLKARINPHFLFNTINNIDVLIKKDPAIASEYLYKLSDTLRYVLYETFDDEIPLKKEVEQMEKFIDLQKIRTNNQEYVSFMLTGTVTDQKIAPMIFMTFVENAVKYTMNKKIKHAINITLDIDNSYVRFYCKNYYGRTDYTDNNGNGLGLDLIKQRLELLYKGKFKLQTSKQAEWFIVDLKINLNDH